MTKTYKLVLLAAAGLAGFAGNMQAQVYSTGDLLVGFYDPSSPNTVVYDLGSATSVTAETFAQWDLSTALTAAGITPSGTTEFGVVGATPNIFWATGSGSDSWSSTQISSAETSVNSIGQYITATPGFYNVQTITGTTATGNDWYNQTIAVPPQSGTIIASVVGNPNSLVGTSEVLYESIGSTTSGRPPVTTPGSETTWLDFSFDPASSTLTYGTAVPEPSTYALLAGAGLMALALRKQLVRKQA